MRTQPAAGSAGFRPCLEDADDLVQQTWMLEGLLPPVVEIWVKRGRDDDAPLRKAKVRVRPGQVSRWDVDLTR